MNKIQFLLSFILIIPVFAAFSIFLIKKNYSLISKFTTATAVVMIINIVNLFFNYDANLNSITLMPIRSNLSIGFSVTNISLIFALITTFTWAIITIYSNKYFLFNNDKRFFAFKIASIWIVQFIILIIFSKNLISLFLFYQCLIFCLYFFGTYFMYEKDFRASHNFTFSLLASSFFMFLAIVFVYKIAGTTDFSNSGIIEGKISPKKYFVLLSLFILAMASVAVFPVQVFYKKLYELSSPIIIMLFVIAYGLVNLSIMLKIVLNIIGFDYFITNTNNLNLSYILNFIIALNLIFSGFLLVIQNNLKKVLIYLFFNQLIFVLFLFLILNQSIDQFIISILSFILSQLLIFLSLGIINIYLLNSQNQTISGLFFRLNKTSILLIFALFNIIGIVPSIGMIEKYILVKNYLISGFDLNLVVIFVNIALVCVAIIRVASPIISKEGNYSENDVKLARYLDNNPALMIPAFMVFLVMFGFVIFNNVIGDYLKGFLL